MDDADDTRGSGDDRPVRRDPRPSQRIRIVGAESTSGEAPDLPDDQGPGDQDRVEQISADQRRDDQEQGNDRDVPGPSPERRPGAGSPPEDPNRFGTIPVIPDDEGPATEAIPEVGAIPPDDATSDSAPTEPDDLELPHWTDPPSGQVPTVGGDDDAGAWSGLGATPRWQGEDEADDFSDLQDEGSTFQPSSAPGSGAVDEEAAVVSFDDFEAGQATASPAAGPPQRPGEADPLGGPVAAEPGPVDGVPPDDGSGAGGADGGGRDMQQALVVGGGLALAAAVALFIGPAAAVVLVAAIIGLATAEFYSSALMKAGYHPVPLIGLVGSVGMVLAAYWRGEGAILLVLFLVLVTSMLWWLLDLSQERALPNIAVTLLGVVYVGVLGSFAALLLRDPFGNGTGLLLGAIIVTVAYDVGGLLIGQRIGTTPLSEASPNKTAEGLIGGGVAAVVAATVILGFFGWTPWTTADAFILGFVGAFAAPLGDLCESRLKRDLGIKDMGEILPGHGGVLDRFDGMLFVLPATYYVVLVLEVYANT